jgi:DNA-binding NarL/FixJ family response regulator
MKRIFIVDDHPMVIEGIRMMLTQLQDVEVCGHAMNAASCLGYFVHNTADVLLLDINLPDQNGMEVSKILTKKFPSLKIIALTNFDQLSYLQSMKEAGAQGYLLKNASLEEIRRAIDRVISGKEYWLGRDTIRESIQTHSQPMITRREIEVLKLIATGLTNHEIAEALFISVTTVDSHRKNLISKLQVKNTAALVRAAIEFKII